MNWIIVLLIINYIVKVLVVFVREREGIRVKYLFFKKKKVNVKERY